MELKDIQECLQGLQQKINALSELKSINGLNPAFYFLNKLVFDTPQGIIRVSQKNEAINRLLVQKYAEKEGLKLFLPEEFISEGSTDWFFITKQEKIPPCPFNSEQILEKFFGTPEADFLKRNKFLWFGGSNAGIKEGKILIYDWVANFAIQPLVDGSYNLIGEEGVLLNGRF